jgi:hypothetical protein
LLLNLIQVEVVIPSIQSVDTTHIILSLHVHCAIHLPSLLFSQLHKDDRALARDGVNHQRRQHHHEDGEESQAKVALALSNILNRLLKEESRHFPAVQTSFLLIDPINFIIAELH